MGTFGVEDKAAKEAAQAERRALHNGFGASLSRAFEIALVPLILGLMGFGLDRWLGTRIVFAVALALFGLVGTFVKLYYGYRADMEAIESDAPWRKQGREAVR
jgi:hypothetical protein